MNKKTLSDRVAEKVEKKIEKKVEDEVDPYDQLLAEVRRFVDSCPSHWRLRIFEESPMTMVVYQSARYNVLVRFRRSGWHRIYRGWFRQEIYRDKVLWKMVEGGLKE